MSLKTYTTQKGRLTPLMFKREAWQAKGEVRKNNYTGLLAQELLSNTGKQRTLATN
jgi:hypothetical protein